ncbi:hypothetical protein NDN08_001025 [Rhodosorus marinus]|uniref:EF-hand domain-containing protein n=1 Tax=Rhodosorus marinus TaxID=101924 RepID=A0AAV8UTU0_9RHOD|nr:hypothetical protein NDN08_001025 [Rhodosorus marinus]
MNSFGDRGSEKSIPSSSANSARKGGLGVSRDIQRKLRYVFNYFDRDDGGTMGIDELKGLLSVLEDGDASGLAESMMKAYCKEDSEELEFAEFLSMISGYYKKHKDVTPFASDCFNIFDRSNTNTVSKDDIAKVMSAIGEDVCELEIESMMSEAGCDDLEEGITEDQFYKLLKRLGLTDEVDPEAPIILPNTPVQE